MRRAFRWTIGLAIIGLAVVLSFWDGSGVPDTSSRQRSGQVASGLIPSMTPWTSPVPTASSSPTPIPTRREESPEPTRTAPPPGPSLRGVATWYRWRPGEAAAGPGLRAFLGKDWRGSVVTVRRGSRAVRVRLTDWCACPGGRIVDLDVRSFSRLGAPSRGILRVEVRRE